MPETGNSFNKYTYIKDNYEKALKEGWIQGYYQPIIRLANGLVCAEDSLVRWIDPEYGVFTPTDIVPALESIKQMHKVDLYMLDLALQKFTEQRKKNYYTSTVSVNFSQEDFYSCDLVDEVLERIEKYNVPPYYIAVKVSEGTITYGDDFVFSQLEQFKELGFQIWLDDFGSGNFTPALLQRVNFDLLKINIFFIRQLITSESGRIITSELVRMATSLGTEVIAEGVESKEQVDFLHEVGCVKAQGYYFCKPIPVDEVFHRFETGTAIGVENPKELDYYTEIGKVSLYDFSSIKNKVGVVDNYFDTMPMGIIEVGQDNYRLLRANKAYRKFLENTFGDFHDDNSLLFHDKIVEEAAYFFSMARMCGKKGRRIIIDDRLADGRTFHVLMERIAVNKVQNISAVVIVILSVSDKNVKSEDMTYNYIARALSEDYINLFYVNMKTDEFVSYEHDSSGEHMNVEKKGEYFFSKVLKNHFSVIYKEDLEMMKSSFTKENIEAAIASEGTYYIRYRRLVDGEPVYVYLKATGIKGDEDHILIGVSNVDTQVRQAHLSEKIKEEQMLFSQVCALSGDFIHLYTVDVETHHFVCHPFSHDYNEYANTTSGDDFFQESRRDAKGLIHPDDLEDFLKYACDKQFVIRTIRKKGIFVFYYRWFVKGKPIHICMKAILTNSSDEKHEDQLLIGVISVENQVRKEHQFEVRLNEAEDMATKDALTGVKNKRAYANTEEELNRQIKADKDIRFAIVMCDINGLKYVNDTFGHQAGDAFIKEGCEIICDVFSRSPVFRIGGDEFLVYVRGKDYDALDALIEEIHRINGVNASEGKVTIAVGASTFSDDKYVVDVFERADKAMYECKKQMKETLLKEGSGKNEACSIEDHKNGKQGC